MDATWLGRAAVPAATSLACLVGVAAYKYGRRMDSTSCRNARDRNAKQADEQDDDARTASATDDGAASATYEEYRRKVKAALLEHLKYRAYVKLAPSAIDGVGVHALVDIPKGVDPFVPPNGHLCARELSIPLRAEELAACPPAVVEHLCEFHAEMDDDEGEAEARFRMAEIDNLLQKAPAGGDSALDSALAALMAERASLEAALQALANDSSEPSTVWRSAREVGGPVYYGINATGPVKMDVSWYLNHSETPNVETVEAEVEGQFSSYRTTRLIHAGEELVTDYREGLESMYAEICTKRDLVANLAAKSAGAAESSAEAAKPEPDPLCSDLREANDPVLRGVLLSYKTPTLRLPPTTFFEPLRPVAQNVALSEDAQAYFATHTTYQLPLSAQSLHVRPGQPISLNTALVDVVHRFTLHRQLGAPLNARLTAWAIHKERLGKECEARLVPVAAGAGSDAGVNKTNVGGYQSFHDLFVPPDEDEELTESKRDCLTLERIVSAALDEVCGDPGDPGDPTDAYPGEAAALRPPRPHQSHLSYAWLNVNRTPDSNFMHTHQVDLWSAVYYVCEGEPNAPGFAHPTCGNMIFRCGARPLEEGGPRLGPTGALIATDDLPCMQALTTTPRADWCAAKLSSASLDGRGWPLPCMHALTTTLSSASLDGRGWPRMASDGL